MSYREDDLAYGHYNAGNSRGYGEGDRDRGFLGDTFKLLKETYKSQHPQSHQGNQGSQVRLVSHTITSDRSNYSINYIPP